MMSCFLRNAIAAETETVRQHDETDPNSRVLQYTITEFMLGKKKGHENDETGCSCPIFLPLCIDG